MNESGLILVVEDDGSDAFLLHYAFQQAGILNPIKFVANAEQAMDYLGGSDPFANRENWPLPSLIFTDLHLPRASGLELVRWIKEQSHLREIPVIAMSGCDRTEISEQVYEAGADLALSKPIEQEKLIEELRTICEQLLVT